MMKVFWLYYDRKQNDQKRKRLACIYKDDLTVEKIKRQKSDIWTSVIKNKDSITQTAFGIDL